MPFSSDYKEYTDESGKEYFYKEIDMSACGFLSEPVVTATLDGQVTRLAVSNIQNNMFNAVIVRIDATHTWLYDDWDVTIHWSAYGYTCYKKCGA